MGIKIGGKSISDINVGSNDIASVWNNGRLIWSKNVHEKTSYWIGTDGTGHWFGPDDTPLINFCNETPYITIDGIEVFKSEIQTIVFDEDYFTDIYAIPDLFLFKLPNLRNISFPAAISNITRIGQGFLTYSNITTLDLTNFGTKGMITIDAGFCAECNDLETIIVANINYVERFICDAEFSLYKEDNTFGAYTFIGRSNAVTSFKAKFPPMDEEGTKWRDYSDLQTSYFITTRGEQIMFASNDAILQQCGSFTGRQPNIVVGGASYKKTDIEFFYFYGRLVDSRALPLGLFGDNSYKFTNLEEITINLDSVSGGYDISDNSFCKSSKLKYLNLPKAVNCGANCFGSLTNDELIIIADNLITVSDHCFNNVTAQSISLNKLQVVNDESFNKVTVSENLIFPLVTISYDNSFNSLSTPGIQMPSIKTIGKNSFNFTNITNLAFPELTRLLGGDDWQHGNFCSKLKSMFNGYAEWDSYLVSINCPKLTQTGKYCFVGCPALRNINLPSLTTISASFLELHTISATFPNLTSIYDGECFTVGVVSGTVRNLQLNFPKLNRISGNRNFAIMYAFRSKSMFDYVSFNLNNTSLITFTNGEHCGGATEFLDYKPSTQSFQYNVVVKAINAPETRMYFRGFNLISN